MAKKSRVQVRFVVKYDGEDSPLEKKFALYQDARDWAKANLGQEHYEIVREERYRMFKSWTGDAHG